MKTACILLFGFWSAAAVAQPAGNNDLLISLYDQLQALQQEVQSLRGLVEEQGYQIQRMQTEQRDRYIDLDGRLSELTLGSTTMPTAIPGPGTGTSPDVSLSLPTPAGTAQATTPAVPPVPSASAGGFGTNSNVAVTPPAPSPSPTSAATPPMDEQELYRTALNYLLEQGRYEESVGLFQSYLDNYPQGRLLTNALYWQGEALILVARFAEARDVFTRLLSEFPQDPKAAGAMLKLGVAHRQLGDQALANQTWREIESRYPESVSEINLARDYLNNRR